MNLSDAFVIIVICGVCAALPQFQQFQQFPQNNQQPQFPDDSFNQQGWNSGNDFFGQNQQFIPQQQPNQRQQPQPQFANQQPTPVPATTTTTTTAGPAFFRCFNNCPTTNEYNPVCGSDGVNYHNVHKIRCTNECGRRVDPNWIAVLSTRSGTCQPL